MDPAWWKRLGQMLYQAGQDLFEDNVPEWAAAISYYALLSTFPLLLVAASAFSILVDPEWAVEQALRVVGELLPTGIDEVEEIVRGALAASGTVGILSTLALLWTGTRVFGTITHALNIAYDVDEVYSFWQRRLAEVTMLLSVGVIFLVALLTEVTLRILANVLGSAFTAYLEGAVTLLAPTSLLLLAFVLLYRFAPRQRPSWSAALAGAIPATLLFLAARFLFLGTIISISRYNLIYGSVGIVVVLVLWFWLAALILLAGGEIASHTQMMFIEGEAAETVRARHEARSPLRSDTSHPS